MWYDSSTTGQEEMAVVLDGTVYLLTNFNRAWTETGAFESFAGAHVNDDREVTFLARDQTSDLVYRHRYRAFRGGLRRLVDVDRNGLVLSTPFYDQGLSVDLEGMSLDRPGVGGVDANGDGSPNVGWYVNGPAMAVPRASFVGDGEVLIVTSLRVPGAGSQDAIVRANLAQPADIVCVGVPNSYGATATLRAIGSDEVSFNDLELRMTYVPSGSVLLPLVSSTTGFTANPGGSHGNLCLGGAIGRGSPFPNVPWASQTLRVYPNSLPQPNGTTAAQAGQTWYFQVWYRDTQGTAPGSNFTSALGVTFR